MQLPDLHDASRYAFFLDFDGTLAEIVSRPEAVTIEPETREALSALFHATGGAVAIVTGREIASVDGFLAPLRLPAAGVHGLEHRLAGGERRSAAVDAAGAAAVESFLLPLVAAEQGLFLGKKHGALALHYRLRPELENLCGAWMEEAAAKAATITLTRGKMVVEARFHNATKGTAISGFLEAPPFANRTPVFAGDDVTDEDAFAVVNELAGISIKVGLGDSIAKFRAAGVREFLDWLTITAVTLGERKRA